jgi:carboxymethylenebutenolidase
MVSYKAAIVFALFLLLPGRAIAGEIELVVPTTGGPIAVKAYTASGEHPRPTVLILHGGSGLSPSDERYARDVSAAGMDAWLFSYYNAEDEEVMHGTDRARRVEYFNERFREWTKIIGEIAGYALTQKENSGHLGLLGFSNGGFLAASAAAGDQHIDALVVFYGGLSRSMKKDINRLPPLLELHGDADRTIPVAQGRALVDRAKELGGMAEQIVYPGAGHGFGVTNDDARSRAIEFLRRQLKVD